MGAIALGIVKSFLTKKLVAEIAIMLLEEVIEDTSTTYDDKYLGPIIKHIKEKYNI